MRKRIFVSQGGYLTDYKKTAVCNTVNSTFSILAMPSEQTVYTGRLSDPVDDRDSGDQVRIADFTEFKVDGTYCLKCGYRRSENFVIGHSTYSPLKNILMSGIYFNRCGYDFTLDSIPEEHLGFVHGKCHNGYTPLYFGQQMLDVNGGWHDGAGYGKYVTSAAITCAALMYSYILYPNSFEYPCGKKGILDECRHGLEWLLKMQAPDGSIYHKCDTAEPVLSPQSPEKDTSEYFVFPTSADASIMFTAAAALGARVFEAVDLSFSKTLSKAASNSWLWIANSSSYEPWTLPPGASGISASDTSYEARGDSFAWMLCEMYSLTGNELFSDRFKDIVFFTDTTGFTLENAGGFGALSYILTAEKKEPSLVFYLKKKFGDRADKIILAMNSDSGYGVALGNRGFAGGYNCMSNMTVISDCIICQTAYKIFRLDAYKNAAAELFQYILGRNPAGISYITGVGETSPMRPAHAQSISSQSSPIPGMIVGGANMERSDEFSKWRLSSKTPPAKCYIDNECSTSTNATSSAFSAAAVLASAFFDDSEGVSLGGEAT